MQADTIVPLASQGVQAFDRFAGLNNNPVRYNDPTGHCIFGLDTAICVAFGLAVLAAVLSTDTAPPPQESPNYPENESSETECSSSLSNCHGDTVSLEDFSGNSEENPVPIDEFEEFADAVAEDLATHDLGWPGLEAGRGIYDTPFYNGGGSSRRTLNPEGIYPSDQPVCIETLGCSARSEINYIGQGMWGAAVGEPKVVTAGIAITWKLVEYQELPSEDIYFWLDYGYEYYQEWQENQAK